MRRRRDVESVAGTREDVESVAEDAGDKTSESVAGCEMSKAWLETRRLKALQGARCRKCGLVRCGASDGEVRAHVQPADEAGRSLRNIQAWV